MNDLKFAIRQLLKNPGFTAVAVLTLALGIGLVTVQFSIISGVLLKGLPFERSDRVMSVRHVDDRGGRSAVPVKDFLLWRDQQQSFETIAAHRVRMPLTIGGDGLDARTYHGAILDSATLTVLRVQPVLGRGFTRDDEQPGAPTVLLLSHHLWQNEFGADPQIVGRGVRLDGQPATIVGVMPMGFAFPDHAAVWWNERFRPGARDTINVMGRLRADATLTTARAEFEVLARQAADASENAANARRQVQIVPLIDTLRDSEAGVVLVLLLGVVLGVPRLVSSFFSPRGRIRWPLFVRCGKSCMPCPPTCQ